MNVETPRRRRPAALATVAALLLALAALPGSSARADLELGIYEGVPWPIIEPPVAGMIAPPPRPNGPPPPPATPAAARVIEVLERVGRDLRQTRYQHMTVVREREGVFLWDCSGMTAWVLNRAAPRAMATIGRARPVARDFVRAIERAPTTRAHGGWQRVDDIADAQPGDVFAWRRPRGFPSRNTGHVGFVVDRPLHVPGLPGAYAVRVADATSWGHQDDTRAYDGVGGFGTGTLVFLTDGEGHGTHYGWAGTRSDAYVTTPIVFGRVSR
ncbi:MAG: hypothetical protein M3Y87_31750 [Myxococcota bacterium]|nr:hypothetical protein [Myxococcota bacterium]